MEYEDLIKDEAEPSAEKPEGADALEAAETPAKSPWKAFVLTGLLAGLIGAIGGGAGIYAGLKTSAPKPATPQAVDLSPLEADFKRLSARLKTAEDKLQAAANRPAPKFEPADLSDVEKRLKALENAPRPEIDPEALKALQSAQNDGFEWPDVSSLETRIAALESETPSQAGSAELLERLAAMEEATEAAQNTSTDAAKVNEFISGLEARVNALENRPAPEPVVERISIPAFPKASLLKAVEVNKKGGLIEKTLSRHIRVKDANDPVSLIEAIEADVNAQQLAPAIEKFERLPAAVRSEGRAWYESVKASL